MNKVTIAAVLAASVATVCANAAYAGPFKVSSTGTSDKKAIKIEAEFKDNESKDRLDFPKLEFGMGVAPNLAVKIKGTYRWIDRPGLPGVDGFSDLEVAAKWSFLKASEKTYGISMATEPAIKFPTGNADRGLGAGDVSYAIPLILGYKRGAWEFGSELGYEHVVNQSEDSAYLGVLVMRRVSPTLKLGTELVFETPDAEFRQFETQANIGLKWAISENAEVQALVGRTLQTPDHSESNKFKLALEYKF